MNASDYADIIAAVTVLIVAIVAAITIKYIVDHTGGKDRDK